MLNSMANLPNWIMGNHLPGDLIINNMYFFYCVRVEISSLIHTIGAHRGGSSINMESFAPPAISLSPSTTQLNAHSPNKSHHLKLLNSYLLLLVLNAIHWSVGTTALHPPEPLPESSSITHQISMLFSNDSWTVD